jgi:hypothetical protein
MCKSCNVFSWNYRLHRQDLEGEIFADGMVMSHLATLATDPKSTDALLTRDGVGDSKPVNPLTTAGIIGVGPDDAPNAIG